MQLRVCGQVVRDGFTLSCDLDLELNGVAALVGASGAGKSTWLRLIAGFEPSAPATVEADGERWQAPQQRSIPAHSRSVSTVFQEPRLFPHLDARRNLEFGQRARKRAGTRLAFDDVVGALDLVPLLALYPHQLSGGQRQRVALGRALLAPAKLWLFDEPMSALDAQSRREIAPYLHSLCQRHAVPIVYVSHSLPEVLAVADQVLLAADGQVTLVESVAAFSTSFANPLLGDDPGAVVHCQFRGFDHRYRLSELAFGGASLYVPGDLAAAGPEVALFIPARDVSLSTASIHHVSILNRVDGEVEALRDQGDSVLARVRCGADDEAECLLARITHRSVDELGLAVGVRVQALIKSVAVRTGDV